MLQYIAGNPLDILTKQELESAMATKVDDVMREQLRGVKPIRVGQTGTGSTDGSGNIAETLVPGVRPREGYVWTVRRVSCGIGGTGKIQLWWGETGASSNPGHFIGLLDVAVGFVTFSRGAFLLNNGESLAVTATGLSALNSQFTIAVQALEVPSEMVGKIVTLWLALLTLTLVRADH